MALLGQFSPTASVPVSAAPSGDIYGVQLGQGLFAMATDGSGRRTILADPSAAELAAAPDDSALVYADSRSSVLHAVSPAGAVLWNLPLSSGLIRSIAWSPTSDQIAFTDCASDVGPCSLQLASPDGSSFRTVVSAPPAGAGIGPFISWGFNGLVVEAAGTGQEGCDSCSSAEYSLNADGTFDALALPVELTRTHPGGQPGQPAAAGSIAYATAPDPAQGSVVVFRALGTTSSSVTYSGFASPAWSPDGIELVLSNGHQVFEVNPATLASPQPISSFSSYGVSSLSWATRPATPAGCSVALQPGSVQGIASAPETGGYWITDAYGSVAACGAALDYGGAGLAHLNKPVTSITPMPDGRGYRLGAYDGGVLNFGTASPEQGVGTTSGSLAGTSLSAPPWSIAGTRSGNGYWFATTDGHVYTFGDAGFYGPAKSLHLIAPLVQLVPTSDGKGYWLAAADGGVFSFGDARFAGSLAGRHLSGAIVGMAASRTGGYWLVGSDGSVYAFGGAPSLGSASSHAAPFRGIASTPDGNGYWLVDANGNVYPFGDAAFEGSAIQS